MHMQSPTNITPIVLEWLIPNKAIQIILWKFLYFFISQYVLQKNKILQFFSNTLPA